MLTSLRELMFPKVVKLQSQEPKLFIFTITIQKEMKTFDCK